MRPQDIMIGDWLRLRYTDYLTKKEVVKDFRVGQLRFVSWDGRGEKMYVGTDHQNMSTVDKMEPIPITHEFLEKNFEKKVLFGIFDDYFDLEIHEINDGMFQVTYHSCEMSVPDQSMTLCYVHELQHFMNHCAIEKEVVL